jgi:prophage antirepressor-like protein
MGNQLELFFNDDIGEIRTTSIDGEPWIVAADVCRCLGLKNTAAAVDKLEDDEKGLKSFDTPGGNQQLLVVNESGVYNLVFRSSKPEAKAFKKWVMHEVLPAIRRNGMYLTVKQPKSQAEMLLMFAQQAVETERRINFLEKENMKQKKAIAAASSEIENTKNAVDSFRKIFSFNEENWKEMAKYVVTRIAEKSLGEGSTKSENEAITRKTWGHAYYRLKCETGVNLEMRQKNREKARGKKVTKLQVIAEDAKLKKIFIGIIKEMAVQFDISIDYESMADTTQGTVN